MVEKNICRPGHISEITDIKKICVKYWNENWQKTIDATKIEKYWEKRAQGATQCSACVYTQFTFILKTGLEWLLFIFL